MSTQTKTDLHRAASRRAVAEGLPQVNVRGIGADLKRLRKKYPSNLRFRLLPANADDGD
jgi:hypothetical protein